MKPDSGSERVVILDRDGTIVVDHGYLSDPGALEFMPGAAAGLRWLHEQGYRLVVVTNQSGVGRGLFTIERMHEVHEALLQMVREEGARLEAIYFCPHAPEAKCACRKPETGLLLQAAQDLGFEPSAAIVIGDKGTDVEFGRRVGAVTMLVSGRDGAPEGVVPDYAVKDLVEAGQRIRNLK
jgi:D-glycero-D-manno-heptose 1,7-bisphosphate phosphatase